MMKSSLILGALIYFGSAHAQVAFNNVTYSGSGCPQGTVSTAVSPDGSTLSILFDEFRAEVPQFDGNNDNTELPRGPRSRERNTPTVSYKRCALSFTAALPPGTKAESLEISVQARGATMLDPGIEATFSSVLVGFNGLASSHGKPTVMATKAWRATQAIDDNWTESPRASIRLNSGCSVGREKEIRFDLRNQISAEILDGDVKKHGLVTVDSADMNGLLKFTVRTKRCGPGNGGRMSP